MKGLPLVTIYMQVYNNARYVEQAVESVLNQTFKDFQFILVNNGCTDGSTEILNRLSDKDQRIQLIYYENNQLGLLEILPVQYAKGVYFTNLDSDDWWEPDYLEKLLKFSQDHDLDIACTGTVMHEMATGETRERKLDGSLVIPTDQLGDHLLESYQFLRTVWNKLIKMDLIREIRDDPEVKLTYGGDTAYCFRLLRHAKRIGIDSTVLHHYRVHNSSLSFRYNPDRFDSDVYLYRFVKEVISQLGPVSEKTDNMLLGVYNFALEETLDVVQNADIPQSERTAEYCRIATHPVTKRCFTSPGNGYKSTRPVLLNLLFAQIGTGNDILEAVQALLPECGGAVSEELLPIIRESEDLQIALLRDSGPEVIRSLLSLREQKQYDAQILNKAILALVYASPLYPDMDRAEFWGYYRDLSLLIYNREYVAALDTMTGLLLENREPLAMEEPFLLLFENLAALVEQAPAFVFGKLRRAQLYLSQGRNAECLEILDMLTQMGVEDPQIEKMKNILENIS